MVGIDSGKVNFILDADIRVVLRRGQPGMADPLRGAPDPRTDPGADKRVIRLIRKWLKAGVLEDGIVTDERQGNRDRGRRSRRCSPTSTCTTCFDLWAERWRRRQAAGDMTIVRYADDVIVGFEHGGGRPAVPSGNARAVREVCVVASSGQDPPLDRSRSRPLRCGRTESGAGSARLRQAQPETFNFPGLHLHLRSLSPGTFHLKRKTRRDRMRAG